MNKGFTRQTEAVAADHEARPDIERSLADALDMPELVARILLARGIESAEKAKVFLKPRLEDLSDPFLMPDMERGVARLIKAVQGKEIICLYGDYDADGVTSVTLVVNFLKHLGVEPVVYIPSRQEGYGLHIDALKRFKETGVDLVICLDCGSANAEEIRFAASAGMDTIIIDHHEMGRHQPEAVAVINPKRTDSKFPTRDLAACGVAFFFLLALRRRMHEQGLLARHVNLKKELDIVTVGTVGDMVPLTGDNRIMVKHGMEVMNRHPKAWLTSMHKAKAISRGVIDEFALGFIIVPRINAAGRVSKPEKSLSFLSSEDEATAASYLADLQDANKHRQRIEEKILREIVGSLKKEPLTGRNSIVVFNEGWHIGVVGIVAQKLTEMYKKPSIVFTKSGDIWKGSGRGGDGLDLFETVRALSEMLLKFGGHKYACGISIAEENLEAFAGAFENSVSNVTITGKQRRVACDTQAEFDELTLELMGFLEMLSPFGVGNPRPNISLRPAQIALLRNNRIKITDKNKRVWYGYAQADQSVPRAEDLYCIASPVLRQEMGQQFINLNVKEIGKFQ